MRLWKILPSLLGGSGRAGAGVCHCACESEGWAVARCDAIVSASGSSRRNTRGCGWNARRGVGVVSGAIAGVRRNAPGLAHSPSRANAGVNMTPGGRTVGRVDGRKPRGDEDTPRGGSSDSRRATTKRHDDARRDVRPASRALVRRRESLPRQNVRRGRSSARRSTAEARASSLHLTVQRPLLDPREARSVARDEICRFDEHFVWRSVTKGVPPTIIQSKIENVYPHLQPPPSLRARARERDRAVQAAQTRRRGQATRTSHVSFCASESTRTTDRVDASANAAFSARQTAPGARCASLEKTRTMGYTVGEDGLSIQDAASLDPSTLTPLSPEVISRQATINIGACPLSRDPRPESRARGLGLNATGRSEAGAHASTPTARAPQHPSPPLFLTEAPSCFHPALSQVRSDTSRTVNRRS